MNRNMRKFCIGVVAAVQLLVPAQHVQAALNLRATLGLEAGLDDDTIRLIERMPEKIREEVINAIRGSLVLIDASVFSYLNRVDEILAGKLNMFQCVVQGSIKLTASEISVAFNPFGEPYPTFVADLQKNLNNFPKRISVDSSLKEVQQAYADLDANATYNLCAVNGTPSAMKEIQEIKSKITSRYNLWARIPEGYCLDARSCFVSLKARAAEDMAKADKRDVVASDAVATMATIRLPTEVWYRSFNPAPYEEGMRAMFLISDSLRVVSQKRERTAKRELEIAQQLVQSMQHALATARAIYPSTNPDELYAASDRALAARVSQARINAGLSEASTLMPELKEAAALAGAQSVEANAYLANLADSMKQRATLLRQLQAACGGGGGKAVIRCSVQ